MEVAPLLLGCTVSHAGVLLRIVETEAYLGTDDAASHARSGPKLRSQSMFGPVGRAYVYLSYGVHLCLNVVCHRPEAGGAVLLRAGTVLRGEDLAQRRRGGSRGLADGPGKLAESLGLISSLDGSCLRTGPISLKRIRQLKATTIKSGPRIGISQNAAAPYRFWVADCPDVSKFGLKGSLA